MREGCETLANTYLIKCPKGRNDYPRRWGEIANFVIFDPPGAGVGNTQNELEEGSITFNYVSSVDIEKR
jgi:hypothetical protein